MQEKEFLGGLAEIILNHVEEKRKLRVSRVILHSFKVTS